MSHTSTSPRRLFHHHLRLERPRESCHLPFRLHSKGPRQLPLTRTHRHHLLRTPHCLRLVVLQFSVVHRHSSRHLPLPPRRRQPDTHLHRAQHLLQLLTCRHRVKLLPTHTLQVDQAHTRPKARLRLLTVRHRHLVRPLGHLLREPDHHLKDLLGAHSKHQWARRPRDLLVLARLRPRRHRLLRPSRPHLLLAPPPRLSRNTLAATDPTSPPTLSPLLICSHLKSPASRLWHHRLSSRRLTTWTSASTSCSTTLTTKSF